MSRPPDQESGAAARSSSARAAPRSPAAAACVVTLQELAAAGVVTTRGLDAAGVPRGVQRTAVRRGELHRLWRGSYALGSGALGSGALGSGALSDVAVGSGALSSIALGSCLPARARWLAALDLAPGAVLCGASAARVLRLDVPDEWPEEIAVDPHVTRLRSRPGLHVRPRVVPATERAQMDGLAITTLARTAIDIALDHCPEDAQWIVDQAVRRGLRPGSWRTGQRGISRAASLLRWAEPGSESPLESAIRVRLRDLPRPVVQLVIRDAAGSFLARVDMAWPGHRVVLEADGVRWHSQPAPLLRDRRRQNALVAAGWFVARATWADVHDPSALRATLASLLARA